MAPTLSELAQASGVSVRTLSAAFREYRYCTPMQALMEQRLQGVRAELLVAARGATVRSIAETWGFANPGLFAARYRQRFGEYPSRTLGLA
ncbi:helix-turn-helix transcriptional regulator [Cupriavidus basilensis]|nr:helix-turn-helix transcriptional regulator [Cupriavidus basilensis]